MSHNLACPELGQEVLGPIERLHLDEHPPDLGEGMGVRASAGRHAQRASQLLGPAVGLRLGPAVDHFDDVDLARDPLDRLLPEVAPASVVGMLEVDEAALVFDGRHRLLWREPLRDRIFKEEADQLALAGQDLLANNDVRLTGFEQGPSPVDAVVIGEEHWREAHLPAAVGYLEWRQAAIERRRAMKVQVHADPGALGASGHVGYYRQTGEGRALISSQGWQLISKDLLTSCNNGLLWS